MLKQGHDAFRLESLVAGYRALDNESDAETCQETYRKDVYRQAVG